MEPWYPVGFFGVSADLWHEHHPPSPVDWSCDAKSYHHHFWFAQFSLQSHFPLLFVCSSSIFSLSFPTLYYPPVPIPVSDASLLFLSFHVLHFQLGLLQRDVRGSPLSIPWVAGYQEWVHVDLAHCVWPVLEGSAPSFDVFEHFDSGARSKRVHTRLRSFHSVSPSFPFVHCWLQFASSSSPRLAL